VGQHDNDAIILLDTLNNTEEARDVIVPGLEKLGLDPADINCIVLSHGHPGPTDHTGGAAYLQETYAAKVMMGGPDWDVTQPAQEPARPLAKRDMDVTTGMKLTLGDTTLTLALLPGHTPGSLGALLPAMHEGEQYSAIFFGGTQMPTRESAAAFENVFDEIAKPLKAATAINAHAGILGDTVTWLEERRQNPDGPDPFFYGVERFDRHLSVMLECGKARVAPLEDASRS
jgi:metallo-beta-lactamase class B